MNAAQQHDISILLCGATGLVGGECLRLLRADPAFSRVVVISRRPLPPGIRDSGVEEHVVDFERLHDYAEVFRVDQVICALGTTIKKAGSKERFRQVDFGYPLEIARMGIRQGSRHFLLVSSTGAKSRSPFFYLRVKGELEEALLALPYQSTTIVRPSLLVGERSEFRLGEELAKRLGFLLPPGRRPIGASDVAAALVHAAKEDRPGTRIVESRDIPALAAPAIANGRRI
jgi:uncharacterized protein YbjT (DUF2867 family)